MVPRAQPQHVIAIYGVGNPMPGEIERSLRATLNSVAPGTSISIHEFDWNQFAHTRGARTRQLAVWRVVRRRAGRSTWLASPCAAVPPPLGS
jgi:hypothetical protein